MPSYKGYNPLGPGDTKPWGQGDLDHEKEVIDSIVMDCVNNTKNLSGHRHPRLYDTAGNKVLETVGTQMTIGGGTPTAPTHKISMQVLTGEGEALRMVHAGYNFMWYDSVNSKLNIGYGGGNHKLEMYLGYDSASPFRIRAGNGVEIIRMDTPTLKTVFGQNFRLEKVTTNDANPFDVHFYKKRDGNNGISGDWIGRSLYDSVDDAGTARTYAEAYGYIYNAAAGSWGGRYVIKVHDYNLQYQQMELRNAGMVLTRRDLSGTGNTSIVLANSVGGNLADLEGSPTDSYFLKFHQSGGTHSQIGLKDEYNYTNKVFKLADYTTAERNAISSPLNGMILHNTTDNKIQARISGSWVNLH